MPMNLNSLQDKLQSMKQNVNGNMKKMTQSIHEHTKQLSEMKQTKQVVEMMQTRQFAAEFLGQDFVVGDQGGPAADVEHAFAGQSPADEVEA